MFSQKSDLVSQAPWWWGALTTLTGIIIGFALKAWFDVRIENRSFRREDKLRFTQEKMQAYAEFGNLTYQLDHLLHLSLIAHQNYKTLRSKADKFIEVHGSDSTVNKTPGGQTLIEDIEAIELHTQKLLQQRGEILDKLNHTRSLILIVAPTSVQETTLKVMEAVDNNIDEKTANTREFRSALARFYIAAQDDLEGR